MTKYEECFQDSLKELINEFSEDFFEGAVTFEENGNLTFNAGLVVEVDGMEFEVTIVRTK